MLFCVSVLLCSSISEILSRIFSFKLFKLYLNLWDEMVSNELGFQQYTDNSNIYLLYINNKHDLSALPMPAQNQQLFGPWRRITRVKVLGELSFFMTLGPCDPRVTGKFRLEWTS